MNKKIFTIPNLLSFFRLCMIPLFVWLYCVKQEYILTGFVLFLSGITDLMDGFIARRYNMASDLGKILDPVADKLTQAVMLICLLTRFPFMILPLMLLIVKETFMAVTGILIIRKTGVVHGADWHGKVATCLLYVMMLLHIVWYLIPPTISNLLVMLCTAMIGLSLLLYAIQNLQILKN